MGFCWSNMGRRIMEWAARSDYMGGIPRKMVIMAVGGLAKAAVSLLNNTTVHNADTLLRLVRSRPPGVPLVTVSNHMSTMDDPLLWGFKGFPITDAKLSRWALAAEDICFKSSMLSYFFRLGKVNFLSWFDFGFSYRFWYGKLYREVHTNYTGWWHLSRTHGRSSWAFKWRRMGNHFILLIVFLV